MPPDLHSILKGVSRSFYLSIRCLPQEMRKPVGIAYLFARASDTLADVAEIAPLQKLEWLDYFEKGLNESNFHVLITALKKIESQVLSNNPSECQLLYSLQKIIVILDQQQAEIQEAVRLVLQRIIKGQRLDVRRFEIEHESVQTEAELLEYCYLVAGCVGEFWTRIGFISAIGCCAAEDSDFPRFSHFPEKKLMELGREFGIGLQLVNVLRDAPRDLENGRCYLPFIDQLNLNTRNDWIKKTKPRLQQGLIYAASLTKKRNRIAVYLPAKLGLKTLEILEKSSQQQWREGLKVSRHCVYVQLMKSLLH